MRYYLGIDGGGTKTKAVLCDEKFNIISAYTGKSINFNSAGITEARKALADIFDSVLREKNITPDAVCIGCAALSSRADSILTEKLLGGITECRNIILDSDIFTALEAMRVDGPCAAAICGTGSMAAGRTESGEIIHTGGFGYLLGDEGSGYAIAIDAMKAVLRIFEQSGHETALTEKIKKHFGISVLYDLFDIIYRNPVPVAQIAAFAPEVIKCAENGDSAAEEIIRKNAEEFSVTVSALMRRLPENSPLGLWGGIMQNSEKFVKIFKQNIINEFPYIKISLLENPPEMGAVFAAAKYFPEK